MAEVDASPVDTTGLVTDGKNIKDVHCQRCGSFILKTGMGKLTQKEMFLPHMKKKSDDQKPDDGETLQKFWHVDGMFTFENVGFSNTVGSTKFLICADCEIGPVGFHDVNDKEAFFIALDRVEHKG